MHPDFADWYRVCTTGTEGGLTNALLDQRWAGIKKVVGDAEGHELDLVRLGLQRPAADAAFLTKFKAAFKEADSTFPMSGNDFELSILAGSAIGQLFTEGGNEADTAALALLCAVEFSEKGEPWSVPFVSGGRAYLEARLQGLRQPLKINRPAFYSKNIKSQFETLTARFAEHQLGSTFEAAKQLCATLMQVLSDANKALSSALGELERQSDLRREETDILWWLSAGISRDLGVTFASLGPHAACVVAGKELADLVRPPGVLPAKSLLQHAIAATTNAVVDKPIALHTAVNASPADWRKKVIDQIPLDRVADLCPVLAAVKYSLSTDEPDGWLPAYKKATKIEPAMAVRPVSLAFQMHRECLLSRLTAEE
jgi:hypothetical protein